MVGKALASPLLTFDSKFRSSSYILGMLMLLIQPDIHTSVATNNLPINANLAIAARTSRNWQLYSTTESQDTILNDKDNSNFESCKQALTPFGFASDEQDKILGKAFGQIHSPYWGEERKKEVPTFLEVNEKLNYLKSLGLTDDDLGKILKNFPEVLGCSLENEMKENVRSLENVWGIKGKTLRNVLLRNPKALGYNVDCKGDCVAQCTRCWARF
ncbi:hypothetical protein CASFOL_012622 [Castilleja foliolosa]|uniref:Uncharacterized protein n=1 Tax=Castilleja foliolosa TaxID=1961234 RepID=A0ABD3DL06_9LAMI